MKHNHNYSCVCEHESVKYCKHCNTTFCTDCGREWVAKSIITWTYNYPYNQYPNIWLKSAQATAGDYVPTVSTGQLQTTNCAHSQVK